MKIPTVDAIGGVCKASTESVTFLTASRLPSGLVRENKKAMLITISLSQMQNGCNHSNFALILFNEIEIAIAVT